MVERILQKLDKGELTYGQAEREFNKLEEGRNVDNVNPDTTKSKYMEGNAKTPEQKAPK